MCVDIHCHDHTCWSGCNISSSLRKKNVKYVEKTTASPEILRYFRIEIKPSASGLCCEIQTSRVEQKLRQNPRGGGSGFGLHRWSSGSGLWLAVMRSLVQVPLSAWDFRQVSLPYWPHFTQVFEMGTRQKWSMWALSSSSFEFPWKVSGLDWIIM